MSNKTFKDEKPDSFTVQLLLESFLKDKNKKVADFYNVWDMLISDKDSFISADERKIMRSVGRETIYSYTRKNEARTPNAATVYSLLTALRKIFPNKTITFEDIVAPLDKKEAENEIRVVKEHIDKNEYQETIQEIKKLLLPDSKIKHKSTKVYLLLEKAKSNYSMGQLDLAEKDYDACLTAANEYHEWDIAIRSKVGITRVCLRKAQYRKALVTAEEALDDIEKFMGEGKIGLTGQTLTLEAQIRRVIGDILMRMGFEAEVIFQWYALALKSIERIVSKEASEVRGHIENNRGIALRQDNRCIDDAIKSHDLALKEFKLFGDPRNIAHGKTRLAMALHRKAVFAHDREHEGLVQECFKLLDNARSVFESIGERRGIAMTWYTEGLIHRHARSNKNKKAEIRLATEKFETALSYYRGLESSKEARENTYLRGEFYTLVALANCHILWSRYKANTSENFAGFEREKRRYLDLESSEKFLKDAEKIVCSSTDNKKNPEKEEVRLVDFRAEQYLNVSYGKLFIERARVEMNQLSQGKGKEETLKNHLEQARYYSYLAEQVGTSENKKSTLIELFDSCGVKQKDNKERDEAILGKYILSYKSDPEFKAQSLINMARAHLHSFEYDLELRLDIENKSKPKEQVESKVEYVSGKDLLRLARKYFIEAGTTFEKCDNFFGRGVAYVGLANTLLQEESQEVGAEYSLGTLRRVIDYYLLAKESFKRVSRYKRVQSIKGDLLDIWRKSKKNRENIANILQALEQIPLLKDLEKATSD